jgi:restriction system protein
MTKQDSKMTFVDATEKILKELKKPTRVGDIADEIVKKSLVDTQSGSPRNTLYSAIYQEIKNREISGKKNRFTIVKGKITLTEWVKDGIEGETQEHNETQKSLILEKISKMPPQDVENLVKILLIRMGFDAETTRFVKDKGIDIRGELVTDGVIRMPIGVQVKRQGKSISPDLIQQLRGSLNRTKGEHGIFITTGKFSVAAEQEAKDSGKEPIDLIDGQQLVNLMVKYKIGVKQHTTIEMVNFTIASLEEEISE